MAQLSTIVTTSPIPSNPSTEMIERVLERLMQQKDNRIILVFDGIGGIVDDKEEFKSSKISADSAKNYEEFQSIMLSRFGELNGEESLVFQAGKRTFSTIKLLKYENITVLIHSIRVGFALAVSSAIRLTETEYVLINQHDWLLLDDIPLDDIIGVMDEHRNDFEYVGFVSRRSKQYHLQNQGILDKLKEKNDHNTVVVYNGLQFCRLFFFFDRTHLTRTSFYKNEIFSRGRFKRGDFIEDTFGHCVKDACKSLGLEGWMQFKCWLYYPGNGETVQVRHLNGRHYWDENIDVRKFYESSSQSEIAAESVHS